MFVYIFRDTSVCSSAHLYLSVCLSMFCPFFFAHGVLTNPSIKHKGHRTPAAPLAPPRSFLPSGSSLGKIVGSRQTNSDTTTASAHRNFRMVGTLRRIRNLRDIQRPHTLANRKKYERMFPLASGFFYTITDSVRAIVNTLADRLSACMT